MTPTISLDMPLSELKQRAVWASEIGQYWYCDWKIVHAQTHPELVVTPEMDEGRAFHEAISEQDFTTMITKGIRPKRVKVETVKEQLELNYRNLNAIEDEIVLMGNRSHRFYYGMIPHDPPIVGVPDAIGRVQRDFLVVYEKKKRLRPDGEPYPGQLAQICVYLMTLEMLGLDPRKLFGVIYTGERFPDAPASKRIYLTHEDRQRVYDTAKKIREIKSLTRQPMGTENPSKCVRCQYGPNERNICKFSPLLNAPA